MRNTLRKGESLDQPVPDEPQKGFLISVPFFHVTGTTSQMVRLTHPHILPLNRTSFPLFD